MQMQGFQAVYALFAVMAMLGAGVVAGVTVWFARKRGFDRALEHGAVAWQHVAEALKAEHELLKERLQDSVNKQTEMASLNKSLTDRIDELTNLNLRLQSTNATLSQEITKMQIKMSELETQLETLRHRRA